VRDGAVAGHAKRRLVRIGLQPANKLLEVFDIQCGTYSDTELEAGEQRDRHEILVQIKARLGLHHRQQIHRRTCRHEDGGSVGVGISDKFDGDQPVRAGAVFDDKAAIKTLVELLRQDSAYRITAAAGREGEDDLGWWTGGAERLSRYRKQ
jgi:hypothetical protein